LHFAIRRRDTPLADYAIDAIMIDTLIRCCQMLPLAKMFIYY